MIAVLLAVLITSVTAVVSIIMGQHYYFRLYNIGDKAIDIKVQQLTETGEPLYLMDQTSVDYGEEATTFYFDAVNSGEGVLRISYSCQPLDREPYDVELTYKLVVSKLKVIFIGEGTYNRNGISAIYMGIIIYTFLMSLYFIWRRRSLSKTHRYSYEYVSTWAGQLFFTGIFLVYAIAVMICLIKIHYIDETVLGTLTYYMMMVLTAVTLPLVFVFAVSMTISNISLIRHEGKRLTNMLGIITGIGLLGAVVVIVILFILFESYGAENVTIAVLYSIANAIYLVFLSVLSGSIISGLLAGHHTPSMDKDYIIILGCAIRKDGSLFPLIRGRVDRAIAFWKAQELKTGKKAVFVPSGGQGSDEIMAEGEAMKRYLLEQGIPEECILAETKSVTTLENMRFSRELIEKINPSAKIAFSTTNYHVMRSGILAKQAGLNAEGMGAATKWYFWPNALLREVAGMFAYQPKLQLLTMLILSVLAGITGYTYCMMM